MWPKYWSFSSSISTSNEYAGLISFRTDWKLGQIHLLILECFPPGNWDFPWDHMLVEATLGNLLCHEETYAGKHHFGVFPLVY